jgi:hypothetical protein
VNTARQQGLGVIGDSPQCYGEMAVHRLPGHCVAIENDTNLVSTHLRFHRFHEAPGTVKPQLIVGEKAGEPVLDYGT